MKFEVGLILQPFFLDNYLIARLKVHLKVVLNSTVLHVGEMRVSYGSCAYYTVKWVLDSLEPAVGLPLPAEPN